MDKKEILAKMKDKYQGLKESGKLNQRQNRSSDVRNSNAIQVAKKYLEVCFKDNRTVVPIDLKAYADEVGFSAMDFAHWKDKSVRAFEIALLVPEDLVKVKGFYGTETTQILRANYIHGKNVVIESNAEMQEAFMTINLE